MRRGEKKKKKRERERATGEKERKKRKKKDKKKTYVSQARVEVCPRDRPQATRGGRGRVRSVKVDLEPLLGPLEDGRREGEVVGVVVVGGGLGGLGCGGVCVGRRRRRRSFDHRDCCFLMHTN